ncbi:cytochrome P450 [Mycena epipterygia]|nr:cytochrome P450 [Mycena epipterygia]
MASIVSFAHDMANGALVNYTKLSPTGYKTLSCLAVVTLIWGYHARSTRQQRLPPGPSGYPLIGNMLNLPKENPWVGLSEMAKCYGPIFSLKILSATIIVIDDPEIANTLLETRSNKYSTKRQSRYADYATNSLALFLMKYNDTFKRLRKVAQNRLSPKEVKVFEPIQENEGKKMILGLLESPDEHDAHSQRYAAAVTLSSIYSLPSVGLDDPLVARIRVTVDRLTLSGVIGRYLVDYIPAIDLLPTWMSPWKQQARKAYEEDTQIFHDLLVDVQTSMDDGTRAPSYTSHVLEENGKLGMTTEELDWITGLMFAGGSDTTASSIGMIIRAMALNPEVQKKAQAELDAIVGRERMPTFEDRSELPYIMAIVKESQRLSPVVPVAPHATSEDDEYNGYFIPAGSMVWANIWSINRSMKLYAPDPEVFRPERFLNEKNEIVVPPGTREQGHTTFGFGRRICPGRHMATSSLFIDTALLLWAFNFGRAKDENGNVIEIDPNATAGSGASVGPAPFKCTITSRIPRLVQIVNESSGSVDNSTA